MIERTVIVAFGGVSPEHEVSVLTGLQVLSALEKSEYKTVPLYISKSGIWYTGDALADLKNFENLNKLTQSAKQCSFSQKQNGAPALFIPGAGLFSKDQQIPIYALIAAFHGSSGENGAFQGICEQYNIPFTGSGVMASSIGMDKVIAKRVCRSENISVVEGTDFRESDWIENQGTILNKIEDLTYPIIIKPVHLGSSIGIEKVDNREDLVRAIETAFRYDPHLLVEKVISPLIEINCSVMGNSASCTTSVCERPLGAQEILSFRDKYQNEAGSKGMASADRMIPADIDDELTKEIQETSKKIFTLLGAEGLARLDFLVHATTKKIYFNEINTIPGSFSFYLWKESKIEFDELLNKLIELAIDRNRQKNGRIQSYETNLLSQKAVKGMKGLKESK